jgi:amino-acid N-acetyltransferase
MDALIRSATPGDIKEIIKILSFYYLDTEKVEENLTGFKVAVLNDKIAGCACLDVGDVMEMRSIALLPNYRNKGIGSLLVDAILDHAAEKTDTVYLRTTSHVFFEKNGAVRLENEEKKKIWSDCAECDKFNICKQIPMKLYVRS